MSPVVAEGTLERPRVVHALPGRVRVQLPGWRGEGRSSLERRLRRVRGVTGVQASPLTGNVLVRFDPAEAGEGDVLEALRGWEPDGEAGEDSRGIEPSPVQEERQGLLRRRPAGRARIPVRGLDRNPDLARRVVERLEGRFRVRASASQLTGRVLVEFDPDEVRLEDLVELVAGVESPELPGEDRPTHPLDDEPLVQSGVRAAGAAAGLGLIAARRMAGAQGPPVAPTVPATISGVIGLLEGFPATRNAIHRLLGKNTASLVFGASSIALYALSGSTLGLALAGAGAFTLFSEVRARREAYLAYESRSEGAASAGAQPGAVVRLEPGERAPLSAEVLEGYGTAIGRDGLPVAVVPGGRVEAGARLHGGPFALRLVGGEPFVPEGRRAPEGPTLRGRYVKVLAPVSLGYAAATALLTRSPARTFAALLLVNPRTAEIGAQAADAAASARALRAGATVVGTRPDRTVRRPDALLLDGPRTLVEGLEVGGALPRIEGADAQEILALAASVAAAAGSPWGRAFPALGRVEAEDGTFDGRTATAEVKGVRYALGPAGAGDAVPAEFRAQHRGEHLLALRSGRRTLGIVALRPRLKPGVPGLVEACGRHGVEISLLAGGDAVAARSLARRAGVRLLENGDAVAAVRERQSTGQLVALVSDGAHAAAGFAACALAVGLTDGRSPFPARADLLAPDLGVVAAVVEAGARRERVVRDSVLLSVAANVFGAFWGLRTPVGVARASLGVYVTGLAAVASAWARLRGGRRPGSAHTLVADPRPERWGRRSVGELLRDLGTTEDGLSSEEAAGRRRPEAKRRGRNRLLVAVLEQLRSPLTAILATGAGLSLALGATADVFVIAAVIVVNAAVSAWQERQAGRAAEALESLGTARATVLRDGEPVVLRADEVVPGDVLLLASGDRVAADARVISARGLEVDEAALTGESLPVPKGPDASDGAGRVVLEGSDVTVGTGRAVVVAVGNGTRMGATAAALALEEAGESRLGARLDRLLRQVLPLIVAGGVIVAASGLLWRRPLLQQLAVGASVAVAAVPEGLPLLAGTGEAAVARRLADRRALVRRLSAVEALGRVDVACADKTGTLTMGRLALSLVADAEGGEGAPSGRLSGGLRRVLLAGALASPHPDAPDARSHPTDVAVVAGAADAGLDGRLRAARQAESPFDPTRSFHATEVGGRVVVKGSAEALVPRCNRVRLGDGERELDEAGRERLLARAAGLAGRGLRVLMVAEGATQTPVEDPRGLVALGFLSIRDPLRPGVPEAMDRCREAGVRVVMLTGDHPQTARAIAREAGLLNGGTGEMLTGEEVSGLDDAELDERLEGTAVVARITPLDKLRIVESLKRRGHTVAMTGDGVNDAPALRLADVGVAMGRGGTEVARQAADVVLADDDFPTLVEALVEGRSFWRNIRRALGLLLGGNLGELGLMVGASALSPQAPLTSRQILAVNLVSDVLPALAVAFQRPEHRNLAALAREGESALEKPLRNDAVRRGIATSAPSLAAYLGALGALGLPRAGSVAFASVVSTQLAQTLAMGRNVENGYSRSVLGAVAGSSALLVGALTVPPLRAFLGLASPTPLGWGLIGAATLTAVPLNRLLASSRLLGADPNGNPEGCGRAEAAHRAAGVSGDRLSLGGDDGGSARSGSKRV